MLWGQWVAATEAEWTRGIGGWVKASSGTLQRGQQHWGWKGSPGTSISSSDSHNCFRDQQQHCLAARQ
jgi:hypothetical protein